MLTLPGGVVWDYDGSQILRSNDAGVSWKVVLPTWPLTRTSLQLTGAFFLNAKDAWVETQHEWPAQPGATTTWETTDGGAAWRQGISLPGAPTYGTPGFDEFAFADAENGFGFGVDAENAAAPVRGFEEQRQDYLWATSDGGQYWRQVPATGLPWQGSTYSDISIKGCGLSDPFNLTAVSAAVAFLWDAGCPVKQPGLWQSTDGGRQWYAAHLPAPPGGWAVAEGWQYPGAGKVGAEVLALRYFTDGEDVLAVTARPGELVIYRSAGAGSTWSLASVLQTGSLARPAGFWASSPSGWELPAPAGLYVTTDAGRHWRLERSGLSLPAMTEVSFASPASGLGFGSFPELGLPSSGLAGMRTADGGLSWQAVQFSASSFLGNFTTEVPFTTVDFANTEDGWVGGTDGVEATTDAGTTWSQQLATAEPVQELSFPGAQQGWALTADELLATSDGGHVWSVEPETPLGAFSYVQLVSPEFGVGVICGQAGGTRVLATNDVGRTWRLLPVPEQNGLNCGTIPPSAGTISGLCFGTAQFGWVVVHEQAASPAVVEKTGDGGLEWSPVAALNIWPGAMGCQGTSDAWLGFTYGEHSTQGALVGTTDGGKTWRTNVKPVPHDFATVPEVTPTDGTLVGSLGSSQSPPGVLEQPVAALEAPAPGAVIDLWTDYGPACLSGFGLTVSTDDGTTWWGAPNRSPYPPPCGTSALPSVGALPSLLPSVSFPDAKDGFLLGPVADTPTVPKGTAEQVSMALISTDDAGHSWRLLARFPWRLVSSTPAESATALPASALLRTS